MSNGFKRICHDTVHGFKQNCLCDICDLLIRRFKKIACICKITFVEALLVQFGSPALSLCLFVSPSSLYPLLFHFSIMETLESFTSPLSIMSFKLFPYFLFLTFSLSSSLKSCLLPLSTALGVISVVTQRLLSPSYHQQLVTGNQPACLNSPHEPLLLLFSLLIFLTSLVSRHLLFLLHVSVVITLRNLSGPSLSGQLKGYFLNPLSIPTVSTAAQF